MPYDQLPEFVSRLRVSDNMQPGRDRSLRLRRRLESEPAPLVRRNPRKPGEFSAAVVAPSRAFNLRHRSVQTDDHAAHLNAIRRSSRRNVCYQLERNRARRTDGCNDRSDFDCLYRPQRARQITAERQRRATGSLAPRRVLPLYRALFGTGSKPKSDAMHSKGRRRPNRVLLSAEEEALIAGGPAFRQSRPIMRTV
jgi:hypothetical protein